MLAIKTNQEIPIQPKFGQIKVITKTTPTHFTINTKNIITVVENCLQNLHTIENYHTEIICIDNFHRLIQWNLYGLLINTKNTITIVESCLQNLQQKAITHKSYVQTIFIDLNNGICMDYIYYSHKEPKGQIIHQKYEVFHILL